MRIGLLKELRQSGRGEKGIELVAMHTRCTPLQGWKQDPVRISQISLTASY